MEVDVELEDVVGAAVVLGVEVVPTVLGGAVGPTVLGDAVGPTVLGDEVPLGAGAAVEVDAALEAVDGSVDVVPTESGGAEDDELDDDVLEDDELDAEVLDDDGGTVAAVSLVACADAVESGEGSGSAASDVVDSVASPLVDEVVGSSLMGAVVAMSLDDVAMSLDDDVDSVVDEAVA